MNRIGQVYKLESNKYVVKCENELFKYTARGVLKIKSEGISVGDYVRVSENSIEDILPRKNKFIRPNVANVDTLVIVVAPMPKPDLILIDKLILNAVKENVEILIVVNKSDINKEVFDNLKNDYMAFNIEFINSNTISGEGVYEIKQKLQGKLAVFAGQSAVGKTSLVNSMFNLNLQTGDISDKILRGRHTTTRSEIFEKDNIKIIDSPGFAVLDADVALDELKYCYPEYVKVACQCRFRGCNHINEPDCAVKEQVSKGIFSKNRYKRYVTIYNEISIRRKIYE